MKQKKAWSYYGQKRKLRYRSQSLLSGPELNGVIGEHTIGAFTSEHLSADARGVRKLTAIEVNLNSAMPIDGGIASNGMIPILKGLQFKQEFMPTHKAWKKSYVASTSNKAALDSYMTDTRIEAICKLMEIANSWVILIFKDDVMLLRVDVADPLHDPKRLDDMFKGLVNAAKVFELEAGERNRLKSIEVKEIAKNVELEVDDDVLNVPVGLELEGEADSASDENGDAEPSKNAEDDKPPAPSKPKENK